MEIMLTFEPRDRTLYFHTPALTYMLTFVTLAATALSLVLSEYLLIGASFFFSCKVRAGNIYTIRIQTTFNKNVCVPYSLLNT